MNSHDGTVAGRQFGVAKLSKLIAVKVLGDDGYAICSFGVCAGQLIITSIVKGPPLRGMHRSDRNALAYVDARISISGMNWVMSRVRQTRRPSIASMSIGGDYSRAENDTVGSVGTSL